MAASLGPFVYNVLIAVLVSRYGYTRKSVMSPRYLAISSANVRPMFSAFVVLVAENVTLVDDTELDPLR
jgi:hypothetical protein